MTETSSWIVDVTPANFEQEVITRSLEVPVILDFWATWCGPCKALTPLLEKRATEGDGRFVLAKVDIDANPELAQAFRVQAVPTVLALVGGRPVDGFQGGLPEPQLDEFLDRVAPGEGGADPLVAEVELLLAEGRRGEAIEMLQEVRTADPEHTTARLTLAELWLDEGEVELAREVLAEVPEADAEGERVRTLAARLAFSAGAGTLAELEARVAATPEDVGARVELAKALAADQQAERGLELLIETVRENSGADAAEARAGMLAIFDLLGLEDPVANDYRFKLSLELFA